jgi:hypothetical protein
MRREHERHLKQAAWYESSPVMMASSRMGLRQTWQEYEHAWHTGEPSASKRRLVSALTVVRHLAQRKHSTCHSAFPNATTTPPEADSSVLWHPPHAGSSAASIVVVVVVAILRQPTLADTRRRLMITRPQFFRGSRPRFLLTPFANCVMICRLSSD